MSVVPPPRSRKLVLVHITQPALLALEKAIGRKLIKDVEYDIMPDGWVRTEFSQPIIDLILEVKEPHESLSDCLLRMNIEHKKE